jgi:hypothetical protein
MGRIVHREDIGGICAARHANGHQQAHANGFDHYGPRCWLQSAPRPKTLASFLQTHFKPRLLALRVACRANPKSIPTMFRDQTNPATVPRGPVKAALAALDAHLQAARWVPYAAIRSSFKLRKGHSFVRDVLNSPVWKAALAERGLIVRAKGKRHGVGLPALKVTSSALMGTHRCL